MLGSTLYYGDTDGFMYERSFDGSQLGAATQIDPYRDATWDGVKNGCGGLYNGTTVAFYGDLCCNVTGMPTRWADSLHVVRAAGSLLLPALHASGGGVVGSDEFTASGGLDWSDVGGMFVNDGTLYFVHRSTGALWSVPFSQGAPGGTPVDVNDPATGGNNWDAHAVFLGPNPPPNQPPVAQASVSCPTLSCTFDGSGSSDPDGTVASYSWDFGDGSTGSGEVASHQYGQAGTYGWTLTVTDNDGASAQTSGTFTVADPASSTVQYVGSAGAVASSKVPAVTVPTGGQVGDLLLLVADVGSSTATVSAPTGVDRLDVVAGYRGSRTG